MSPIRVGFIGLSKSGWARNAHFPYLESSDDYQIVALCNSSIESSKNAIKEYKLPETTKVYGDVEAFAADVDIDLVVCSIRADKHYAAIVPSIKAGKNIYCEWPLGKTATESEELLELSKSHGVKLTYVGLQGRYSPVVKTLKSLVQSGRIGEVLSSSFTAQAGYGGDFIVKGFEYASQEFGGDFVTIFLGHTVDFFQEVLGDFDARKTKSLLNTNQKFVKIIDGVTGATVKEKHPRKTFDSVFIQGHLKSGAVANINMRGGKPFKDSPAMDWRILGKTGEIRLTAKAIALQMGDQESKIEVYDYATDEVEVIPYTDELQDALKKNIPHDELLNQEPSKQADMVWRNVGRLYAAIARGETPGENGSRLLDFEKAVGRHKFIEQLFNENL